MKDKLHTLDGTAMARLVATNEVTAAELLEAAIARIEAHSDLNAVAGRGFEVARARAQGALSGPFAGVPFLVKDLLPYPGLPNTFGARLFAGFVAPEGSPYTERLDAAGLVALGKSATSELGLLGSTESLLLGVTKNPWQAGISAMGSSGGAAAAVAAGLVPLAHASDGGGSIRIPASANGLFGFMPGRGVTAPLAQPVPGDLVREHCVTKSVRDSAAFLAATAQAPLDLPAPDARPGPLEIGVYTETLMGQAPDPAVGEALEGTVSLLERLGHRVRPIAPPPIDGKAVSEAFFTISGALIKGVMDMMQGMLQRPIGEADLEPFTLALVERFLAGPPDAFEEALATAASLGAKMQAYLSEVDVALCPTMPVEPWPIGTLAPTLEPDLLLERTERLAGYTAIHNMAGTPAMSVPLAVGPTGLPIGSHFAAARGQEPRLFALAYQLEAESPWADRLPYLS